MFTPKYRTTERYCSPICSYKDHVILPKKPINKFSKKRKKENAQYLKKRKEFLSKPENRICYIGGCGEKADTIEHTKGRKGFADDWAKQNNISLYLDERFWEPCCNNHNLELEINPELSKKYQLSKIHDGKKI